MSAKPAIFTIGHSTHPLDEFIGILQSHEVDYVVDVRTIPRSRTNPQFNKDSLPAPLSAHGIGYRQIAELGGRRSRRGERGESPNDFWQNQSFRNYADYAMTTDFRKGLEELKAIAAIHRCAMMCAEAVWWRCHRRIVADYLMAENYPVFHIMSPHKAAPATITQGANILPDGQIRYTQKDEN